VAGVRDEVKRKKPYPLAKAIEKFNAEAQRSEIGKQQPPLSEDEVLAAIRWLDFSKKWPFSQAALEQILQHRRLPNEAFFEVQTAFAPGDELEYTIWSVRLRMPDE